MAVDERKGIVEICVFANASGVNVISILCQLMTVMPGHDNNLRL